MSLSPENLIGQRIGSYQVVRLLGAGGMGVVYEAAHEQLKRRVAIKVLNTQLASNPQNAERFRNEARIVSAISHPGLVSIFEIGSLPSGQPYIVMEYLDGESLAHRITRCGAKLGGDTLRITRQIASTLGFVHARGVVHRDLKPDNIIIVADSEAAGGERAKILDFGIAKIVSAGDVAGQVPGGKTRTGLILGTPAYMAPEQCRGAGLVDEKADVYALGVMLYEMLSGQPLFSAEGIGELMALHMFQVPPPITEIVPVVACDVAELVHAMLAKRPQDRPTANQVASRLEELGAPRATDRVGTNRGADLAALPSLVSAAYVRSRTNPTQGAGQLATLGTLQFSRPIARRYLAIAAAAVSVLTSLGGGLRLLGRPAAPPASERVSWRIESEPAGAQIRLSESGDTLGRTPLVVQREATTGQEQVVVSLPGYVEESLNLHRDRNEAHRLRLQLRRDKVTVRLVSQPAGATVRRLESGEVLGKTPLDAKVPYQSEPLRLSLQLGGFQELQLELDPQQDHERTLRLQPRKRGKKEPDLKVPLQAVDD